MIDLVNKQLKIVPEGKRLKITVSTSNHNYSILLNIEMVGAKYLFCFSLKINS
jgi:hypothetical protein